MNLEGLDYRKVCGKHSAIYEAYYKQIDAKGSGAIEAMTAARFLKKSGLSDVVLSRVWDLSDPNGKGFLDKPGFFIALKLVSLAQAGQVINMSNIYAETQNPPKVGDLPKIMPQRIQTVPVGSGGVATTASGDWSISVIDRLKYEQLFESLKPMHGMLQGNKVKGVLMDSKLPMETLGKIWDLADQDKDGNLDKHEFIVAMHLVYQTLEKRTVPDVLPPELRKPGSAGPPPPKPAPPITVPPAPGAVTVPRAPSGEGFGDSSGGFVANFPKDIAPPPAIPPLPVAIPPMTRIPPVGSAQPLIPTDPLIPIGAPPSVTAAADWVVTPSELKRFEVMFRDSDRDKDGLVSGLEVKNIFLQSGVPQHCLAHIWALCDTNQSGKLTLEQFALAMWMVELKQKGIEPPQVLTANMVPPSMRGIVSGVDVQPQAEPKPTYTNPELEMISKEIEELAKERRALETEIAQKEADIRIKSGEVRSLQSELDTLSATLKQLEHQRGEAQKRLDDLKAQVNKIRDQCQLQEDTINEQEGELNAKRSELQKLKDEETALQKEYDDNNRELQKLNQHLQNTQLQISSVRSMVTQLMETQRQMTDALLMCRAAIENQDAELVTEYQLKIEPDFDEARKTLEKKIDPEPTNAADPFGDNAATKTTTNGFGTSNGFDSVPFASAASKPRVGFDDDGDDRFTSGFDSGFDAFGSSNNSTTAFGGSQQKDPFGGDAFGAKKVNAVTPEPGKDDFGSDPFAALHAPTGQGQVLSPNTQRTGPPPRPESPSPALPPKKSKVPPPRPAPPRPGPARPAQPAMDAFGSTSNSGGGSGGGGFADFDDFDNKLLSSNIPSSTPAATATVTSLISQQQQQQPLQTHHLQPSRKAPSPFDKFAAFDDNISTISSIASATTTSTTTTTFPLLTITANNSNSTITNTNVNTNTNAITTTAFTPTPITNTMTSTNTINSSKIVSNENNNHNNIIRSITPQQQHQQAVLPGSVTTTTSVDLFGGNKNSDSSSTLDISNQRKTPIISGPTDFSDDPFKDYRYEDPFNIKDPFDDDDDDGGGGGGGISTDPEKVFKDELLSSDDDEKKPFDKVSGGVNAQVQTARRSASSPFNGNNSEFLHQFDAFNINPSPVPSHHSSTSGANISTAFNNKNNNTNANKSQRNTPISQGSGGGSFGGFGGEIGGFGGESGGSSTAGNTAIFDAFADFDAFSSKSTSTIGSGKVTPFNTTNNNQQSSLSDSFFGAFDDNFNATTGTTKSSKYSTTNDSKSPFSASAFDAFGDTKNSNISNDAFDDAFGKSSAMTRKSNITATTTTNALSTNLFDDFNSNTFEDDFFKQQQNAIVAATTTTTIKDNKNLDWHSDGNIKKSPTMTDDDFAKFDAFGASDDFGADFKTALNNSINHQHQTVKNDKSYDMTLGLNTGKSNNITKVQNQTTLMKTPNVEAATTSSSPFAAASPNNTKIREKYSADYSKPESFDDDLQEALRRSMMDQ